MSALDDLRFAWRGLRRGPGFALVAILALALGLGANLAIFAVVDAVLLEPLPVAEEERLHYLVMTRLDKGGHYSVPYHNAIHWRERARSFQSLTAIRPRTVTARAADRSERLSASEVPASYFATLGARPILGRALRDDDRRAVVLSHELWQRRFGAGQDVLGRVLDVDGEPHEIVGVMPAAAELHFLGWRDLWLPLEVDETAALTEPLRGFQVLARLAEGVSAEEARRELDRLAAEIAAESPATNEGWGVEMHPVRWWIFGEVETALWLLAGAGLLVLLVACATVATLISSRAVSRRREIAVRRALGAGHGILLRQLLCESLLLAVAGGSLGVVLAMLAIAWLPAWEPGDLPRLGDVRLGSRALVYAGLSVLGAGVLSGLAPALAWTRRSSGALGASGTRTTEGRGGLRTRQALVACQVALATLAAIGSGLLVRTLQELRSVDLGFEPRGLLTLRLDLDEDVRPEKAARIALFEELLKRLGALAGVESAAMSGLGLPPLGSAGTFELFVEGGPRGPRPDVIVSAQMVSPGYFETLGVSIIAGRVFASGETWESARAVVVNQTLAERYWPGEAAVGRWVEWQTGDRGTIVGVVGDVRELGLRREPGAIAYLAWGRAGGSQNLALRTSTPPLSQVPGVQRTVQELLPGTPLFAVRSGEDLVAGSYAGDRFTALLMGIFAFLAQALGLLGVYSVVAHWVSRRTREIGVRMALGALPSAIGRWVTGQGLRPVVAGLLAGIAFGLASGRYLESQLYGVAASDPATFVTAAGWILLTAVAICALPARRAAHVDPAVALAQE